MKLFSEQDKIALNFSMEEFRGHYQSAKVISAEALSDYFYKVKDVFSNVYNSLSTATNDQVVVDTTSTKFETMHRVKRVKFIDIKDFITSKPENFRGKYVDYTLDLINASKVIVENTESTLNNLKLAVSSFVNEYSENKVSTLYGAVYFKEAEKLIEENKKDITKYFPESNSSTKAYIRDVLKTNNDVESLYKNIEMLDSILNLSKIEYISKLTNECVGLLDTLIDQNTKTDMLTKNDTIKKELISAIHISAREVEFLNYLYANAVVFYGCFKNLTQDLNKAVDTIESN